MGVVGRTGNGKTTLTPLLVHFYDPTAETIWWANADVRSLQPADLRRSGLVTQDVRVFMTSVRDNLILFGDDILDEQILHALDDPGLMAWYRRLPHGLETWIALGGLSAGEAQMLALARVFLKDPALVILDEASSRLDPATEPFIKRALDRLTVALHLAVLEDDIAGMPQGLETVVGPRGVRLSGGQVQRTLPRIFSCAPALLVFDDVSSALDGETEALLWERLGTHSAAFGLVAPPSAGSTPATFHQCGRNMAHGAEHVGMSRTLFLVLTVSPKWSKTVRQMQ